MLEGRLSGYAKIPDRVIEWIIATETGWKLEYIRNMPIADYDAIALMARIYMSRAPRNQIIRFK